MFSRIKYNKFFIAGFMLIIFFLNGCSSSTSKGVDLRNDVDGNVVNGEIGDSDNMDSQESLRIANEANSLMPVFLFSTINSFAIDFETMKIAQIPSVFMDQEYMFSYDGFIHLYETKTLDSLGVVDLNDCSYSYSAVQVDKKIIVFCDTPDRKTLANVFSVPDLTLQDTIVLGDTSGHLDPSFALLSPYKNIALISDYSSCANFLNIESFTEIYPGECLVVGKPNPSPDGKYVIFDNSVKFGSLLGKWEPNGFTFLEDFGSQVVAFSSEGKYLAYYFLSEIVLMNYETGEDVAHINRSEMSLDEVVLLVLSPDASIIFVIGLVDSDEGYINKLVIYDVENRRVVDTITTKGTFREYIKYLPTSIRQSWSWVDLEDWVSIVE